MKTKKSLLVVLAVIVGFASFATEIPKVEIHPLHADQIVVTALNNQAFQMEVNVYAENGEMVYYKKSEKPVYSYHKVFDVKNLENGDYRMKLKVNDTTIEKLFSVTTRKIYFNESELYHDPFFAFDGKNLKVSYLNFKKENFVMEIYKDLDLVYKEKVGDDFSLQFGYNLRNLEEGSYKVVLNSLNKSFDYSFNK